MAESEWLSQLQPDQAAQLTDYQEKWRRLAFPSQSSTEAELEVAVTRAYSILNEAKPEVLMFDSLFDIPETFWSSSVWHQAGNPIPCQDLLLDPLIAEVSKQVTGLIWGKLWTALLPLKYGVPLKCGVLYPTGWSHNVISKMQAACFPKKSDGLQQCSRLDFCHQVLGCALDVERWTIAYDLIQHCGWLFSFEHLCLAIQKRITEPHKNASLNPGTIDLIRRLERPAAQVLARLELAAREATAGYPKHAFESWRETIAVAYTQPPGLERDRILLTIIQQAKSVITYTDTDDYPFTYGATSHLAPEIRTECERLAQSIETPEPRAQALAILSEL